MIKIIQGTQKQVNNALYRFKTVTKNVVCLHDNLNFPASWYGLQQLVHYLRNNFDQQAIDQTLSNNKAVSSFIFPEYVHQLSSSEKKEYDYYFARMESRLNVPYGLYEAIAKLMDQLTRPFAFTILLPNMSQIDPETLRVIEHYYRYIPNANQNIVLGFATDLRDAVDENGITWHRSGATTQFMVGGFSLYPQAELIQISDQESTEFNPVEAWTDYQEENPEKAFYDSLDQMELTDANVQTIVDWMEKAYGRFSFRALMKVGMKTLESGTQISDSNKALIHGFIGTAAHFYQFSHLSNPPFDKFLIQHFLKAIEHENRPAIRCALLYRIAFNYAERLDDQETARKWADQGVKEAQQNELSPIQRDYHRAWAYNVRGHVYAFSGLFDEFAKDSEEGFALLENRIAWIKENEDTTFNYWLNDYKFSFYNLAIHQVYTGDETDQYDYSRRWFPKAIEVMNTMPRIMWFDTFHWIDYHRNKLALQDALAAAEVGIEDALKYKHHQLYVYSFSAADLAYRIGDARKAIQLFQQAQKHRPIYNDIFKGHSTQWFIGNCHLRLGEASEAESIFKKELSTNTNVVYQIKLFLQLAIAAAQKSAHQNMEARINKAIDLAVSQGEQNLLMKVASTAGYCLHLTEKKQAAQDAYKRALNLTNTVDQEGAINSTYLLETYVGHLTVFGYNEALTIQAIRLIPETLDDLQSWWNLPDLLPFVDLYTQSQTTETDEELKSALAVFYSAIAERTDCNLSLVH